MKIEIKVPAAGESVTEADIAVWHKANGDMVELDEAILELETDKASLELTAEEAGQLTITVEEGETVQVGDVIGFIETDVKSDSSPAVEKETTKTESKSSSKDSASEKIDIIVPAAGESVNEADIASWSKSDGDFVEIDEVILELETDKASLELTAEASGILTISVQEGETVQVGQVIGYIVSSSNSAASTQEKETPAAPSEKETTQSESNYAKGHPSPSAAKLMSEENISLSSGSGKDGRVTKQDVVDAVSKKASAPAAKEAAESPKVAPIKSEPGSRTTRREKMTRLRRTISTRLVEAQQTAALLTTFNEIDMSGVMDMRKKYKEAFKEKYAVGLGFMSFFSKAAAIALQDFPILNAQVDEDHIIFNDFCDIGIAVATPRGLVVPVIRNVEKMTFQDVESTIMDFAVRGRAGNITPDDMTGGTFTITNGGTFGSMLSTPIVNRPQSAILGMHNIVQRPTAVNGQVEIRPIMYVAVTYDHRIIDGSDAVQFLVRIKELIEDPSRIMLEV